MSSAQAVQQFEAKLHELLETAPQKDTVTLTRDVMRLIRENTEGAPKFVEPFEDWELELLGHPTSTQRGEVSGERWGSGFGNSVPPIKKQTR